MSAFWTDPAPRFCPAVHRPLLVVLIAHGSDRPASPAGPRRAPELSHSPGHNCLPDYVASAPAAPPPATLPTEPSPVVLTSSLSLPPHSPTSFFVLCCLPPTLANTLSAKRESVGQGGRETAQNTPAQLGYCRDYAGTLPGLGESRQSPGFVPAVSRQSPGTAQQNSGMRKARRRLPTGLDRSELGMDSRYST